MSPAIAAWFNRQFPELEAESVRLLGLRDAADLEIFNAGREAGDVVMSQDGDLHLLERYGPPPQLIWITCGNTSNTRMRQVLSEQMMPAVLLLQRGEAVVEIRDRY